MVRQVTVRTGLQYLIDNGGNSAKALTAAKAGRSASARDAIAELESGKATEAYKLWLIEDSEVSSIVKLNAIVAEGGPQAVSAVRALSELKERLEGKDSTLRAAGEFFVRIGFDVNK